MALLELSPRALRDLRHLPRHIADDVLTDLEILRVLPWPGPPQVKRVHGTPYARLRTGGFRSIVMRSGSTVIVLRVVDRKDFEQALRNLQ